MRRASPTRAHESQFPRTEVFLNYPFDSAYLPLYQAIVFTVMALGYQIRMALEVENSGLSRLAKIVDIIRETPMAFTTSAVPAPMRIPVLRASTEPARDWVLCQPYRKGLGQSFRDVRGPVNVLNGP